MRELTSLGKEVIKGVTEVGNMVLIQRPVLPLSLAQTLHQLCRGQRTMSKTALTLWSSLQRVCLVHINPTVSPQTQLRRFKSVTKLLKSSISRILSH